MGGWPCGWAGLWLFLLFSDTDWWSAVEDSDGWDASVLLVSGVVREVTEGADGLDRERGLAQAAVTAVGHRFHERTGI